MGWRVAAMQRLHAPDDAGALPDRVVEATPDAPAAISAAFASALTVRDARLLRALEDERADVARRLRRAPRHVAADALLARLAVERPRRLDDPLLAELPGAAGFLRRIAEAD